MGTSVKDLIDRPFDSRPLEEQLEIVKAGKPKPKTINGNYFEKEKWLTASEENNAFFCWSCLLFVSDRCSVWNTIGYVDKGTLFQSLKLHKSTEGHINGLFEYQSFINKNLASNASQVVKLNSIVVKNRGILKRIIDVVCHMTNVDSPIRLGIDNFDDDTLLENFFEYLDILKYYDLNKISDEVIQLVKESPTILMHTVGALSELISLRIKREVQSSSYVSLIFSEHLDADLMSKLSCVLRYVKDGKVQERFTGFTNFIGVKSNNAPLLTHCITEVLSKFDAESKFIALSCDGAVIMSSSHLNSFVNELSSKYPRYKFVPCYYHDFESVLEQTLSAVFQECHIFFQQIRSMNSFYKSCAKLTLELHEIMKYEILNFSDLKFSNSHFLKILKMHRQKFILYFNVIVSKYAEYSADDVASASGFIAVLKDLHTVFFLEMFNMVFTLTSVFSEPASGAHPECVFEKGVFDNLVSTLRHQADSGFASLWSLVMQEIEKTVIPIPGQSMDRFSEIYHRVMVYMVGIIETRYQSVEDLNFFQILKPDTGGKFVLIDEHAQNLLSACKDTFDITLLKYELSVMNANKEMLAPNSIHELLESMERANMQKTFQNVDRLANYILAMPCKPPSLSGEPSKFEAVNAWSVTAKREIFTDDWSLLAVEKDVLSTVRSEGSFMDDFLREFGKLNVSFQVS